MTPANLVRTADTQGDIVRTGPSLSQWDADEPFVRFTQHFLKVARAANSLCVSQDRQNMGEGLALFTHDWPNLREGWEWSRDRMNGDSAAAQLCRDYLYSTSEVARGGSPPPELVVLIEGSLAAADILNDVSAVTFALCALGISLTELGRYFDAEDAWRRALAAFEKTDPDNYNTGIALQGLGRIYLLRGRHAEAEPLYQRALTICLKAAPEGSEASVCLSDLAVLLRHQGRYAEAEALHYRALAITEKAPGREDPNAARNLINMALLYEEQGHYGKAEPLV
jgi:tetratricopeptide (TPR) repeat protein